MSSRNCDINWVGYCYRYMIDVNFRIVCIDVSEQTPHYRGNAAENLMNSEMIINIIRLISIIGLD